MIPTPQTITQDGRREAFDLAIRTLPRQFEPADLYAWIEGNAPWVEDVWIHGRLVADTVNDPGRQHVPGPRDLLYGRPDGTFERYDPNAHGWWSSAGRPTDAPTPTASVTPLVVQRSRRVHHRKAG